MLHVSKSVHVIAFLFLPFLFGCSYIHSIPVGLLYTNTKSPRSYRSANPGDVAVTRSDPKVIGKSCNRSLLYLVSWGDSGYARAADNALKDDPNAILYDVKIDSRVRSFVLGLYTDTCTIMTGRRGQLK